jgi:hypothetical protein
LAYVGYACTPKCRPTFLPSLGAGSPARVWDRRWGQPGTLDGLRETRNSSGLIMRAFRPRSLALQRFGRTSSYFCVDTAPLSPQSSSQEGSEQQTPRGNDSSASIKERSAIALSPLSHYTPPYSKSALYAVRRILRDAGSLKNLPRSTYCDDVVS